MIKKPLLAVGVENLEDIKFPVLASYKLDGIRALVRNGRLVSRNFIDIPNKYIQSSLKGLPDGLDGELILADTMNFNDVQSAVMSEDGEPAFIYSLFDYVKDDLNKPFKNRTEDLKEFVNKNKGNSVSFLNQESMDNLQTLMEFEQITVDKGFEGVMIRNPEGRYKEGRSTLNEGILLKIKRFEDDEAVVVGFEEKMSNQNEKVKDLTGKSKRSSHKENMVPAGMLGAFLVHNTKTDQRFNVASGLTDEQRLEIWNNKESFLGKYVKYKYQPSGAKDLPRFPVFLGFRDVRDL